MEAVHPRVCGGNDGIFLRVHRNYGTSPRVRGKHNPFCAYEQRRRYIPACAGETSELGILTTPTRVHPRVCGETHHQEAPGAGETVHPRVCGGNFYRAGAMVSFSGTSPRVRGKPVLVLNGVRCKRYIPACAGETARRSRFWTTTRVHPRVCGGNRSQYSILTYRTGTSPRVRGKRVDRRRGNVPGGYIPACAGETETASGAVTMTRVHPRVCGGNLLAFFDGVPGDGTSPHVRGKPRISLLLDLAGGYIPACAGETRPRRGDQSMRRVHPRMCGGNHSKRASHQGREGTSPHVRGKPRGSDEPRGLRGHIPACAGETQAQQRVFDRFRGTSPRVRGKHSHPHPPTRRIGHIPACAGETGSTMRPNGSVAAHPRVCGGNSRRRQHDNPVKGTSPRVRGKRRPSGPFIGRLRHIPACAGETEGCSPRACL